ncbi:MAG: AAA family ATPase [Gammaproteobacteria bacterium]|nr:AAA family ATPase [Gammaproteobacteria bacterium]
MSAADQSPPLAVTSPAPGESEHNSEHNGEPHIHRRLLRALLARIQGAATAPGLLARPAISAPRHLLLVGQKGSGRSALLGAVLRSVARTSPEWLVLRLPQHCDRVTSAGEFWLETLRCLCAPEPMAPATALRSGGHLPDLELNHEAMRGAVEQLHAQHDDRILEQACRSRLRDLAISRGLRLLLLADNLDRVLSQFQDSEDARRLARALDTDHHLLLVASVDSTPGTDSETASRELLAPLFSRYELARLDDQECHALWQAHLGRPVSKRFVRGLRILTGGHPRLVADAARVSQLCDARLNFRALFDGLQAQRSQAFADHIDSISARERGVLLALLELGKPASARQIAELARVDTSKASALLYRLAGRGDVMPRSISSRRKVYVPGIGLDALLYRRWRCPQTSQAVVDLIDFMDAWFGTIDGVRLGHRIIDHDFGAEDPAYPPPTLADWTDLRPAATTVAEPEQDLSVAGRLMVRIQRSLSERVLDGALRSIDQLLSRLPDGATSAHAGLRCRILFTRATTLARLGRPEQELHDYDALLASSQSLPRPLALAWAAHALYNKAVCQGALGKRVGALATYYELLDRIAEQRAPSLLQPLLRTLATKAAIQAREGRLDESLKSLDPLERALSPTSPLSYALIDSLLVCAAHLGPERILELIEQSGLHERLLPLLIALRQRRAASAGRAPAEPGHATPGNALDLPDELAGIVADLATRFGHDSPPPTSPRSDT